MIESSVSTRLAWKSYIQNDIYRNIPMEINDENKGKQVIKPPMLSRWVEYT